MESANPPPAKKIRSTTIKNSINVPLLECRREFNLPQQFPSTLKQLKNNGALREKIGTSTTANLRKEAVTTNSMKKMRIRSQDGRDLGEVKVKFLSHEEILKTNTMKLTKSKIYNLNKPIQFCMLPLKGTDKICYPPASKTNEKITLFNDVATFPAGEKFEMYDKNKKSAHKPLILSKAMNNISIENNIHNKKLLVENKSSHKTLHNVQSPNKSTLKCKKLQKSKSFVLMDAKKNSDLLIRQKNGANYMEKSNLQESTLEILTDTDVSDSEKDPTSKEFLQLATSKFPVVQCEKLTESKNKDNVNGLTESPIKEDTNKFTIRNAVVEEMGSIRKMMRGEEVPTTNVLTTAVQEKPINSVENKICNTPIQEKHQCKIKFRDEVSYNNGNKMEQTNLSSAQSQNFTDAPVNDKTEHINIENISININKQMSDINEKQVRIENIKSKDSNPERNNNRTNNDKSIEKNVSEQEKLSEHWNIIKEALISVKDEELRSKALQALANCGIGVPKHIPITPPENMKTVHDSQIQTDVFGLLDLESFILVNEDKPSLERIKQTERTSLNPSTVEINALQHMTMTNNYIDNDHLFPRLTSMSSTNDILEIDNCFNTFFNGNSDASRVKQVLSTPHSLYGKIVTKLQEDFVAMKQWDECGMLNIHRAVIDNDLREVQRLLLVLKASKTSIDVLTEDGTTCLELAIKSNSSSDILQLLLEAGAKPVSSELLHDSAVILASKLSSPLLPNLLKFVKNPDFLNQVDSLGFAPLHYCALNGNFEGVNALIEAGADVNLKDNLSGRTPFFHALEYNYVSIAQRLQEKGAIANLPNFSGQSVLSLLDESKSLSLKAAWKQMVI